MVLPTDLKNLLIAYEKRILALEELTQQLRKKVNEIQQPKEQPSKKRTKVQSSKES